MSLQSLVQTGTKLWLDSVDPDAVKQNFAWGATGATSNPIIISDLLKTGRHDDAMAQLIDKGMNDEEIAWAMTDKLVKDAQSVFLPVWEKTGGNDGYVSFELDPILEDVKLGPPLKERTRKYVELGKKWSAGHKNRMIKVPATQGGLDALEELAALGITLNVTLIFSERQYKIARDAIWRGAQRRPGGLDGLKSVYSIFISRVDVYTDKKLPELSDATQGCVGIYNAKRLWKLNQDFWSDKRLRLQQEFIFASTGAKLDWQEPDYYVSALAGSDIQTNPPATNDAVRKLGKQYSRQVDKMPPQAVIDEILAKVDMQKMENALMEEGTAKFSDPHKALLGLIGEKRSSLTANKR